MGGNKLRIVGTGLTGLVGSRIYQLLSPSFHFISLSRSAGLDITDDNNVYESIQRSNADMVLHMAAKTDVDACEQDKTEDMKLLRNIEISNIRMPDVDYRLWKGSHSCFGVNSAGTYHIAETCRKLGKKLLYVSTDFVFDGSKKGAYKEDDLPNPINFYGQSKWMGEKIVQNMVKNHLILRISYPFGITSHQNKKDFIHEIVKRLHDKEKVYSIVDHVFTPTFLDDIAYAIELLVRRDHVGIVHVTGSQSITPYQATLALARHFRYDTSLINKITLNDFYHEKAMRPRYLSIDNSKIRSLGARMSTFGEVLKQISEL